MSRCERIIKTNPAPQRKFLTYRQSAIYKPSLWSSGNLPSSRQGRVFFFMRVDQRKGFSNVEPEGAFCGVGLFAGMSVEPAPARSGYRQFLGHGFGQLRRSRVGG